MPVAEPGQRTVAGAVGYLTSGYTLCIVMTVYDAVYIALALEHQIPLLTAERPGTPWIKKLGSLADTVRV
jgi:hypothetical protein